MRLRLIIFGSLSVALVLALLAWRAGPSSLVAAGVVVDDSGVPIRGALVGFNDSRAEGLHLLLDPARSSTSDGKGEFELRSRKRIANIDLCVQLDGYALVNLANVATGRNDWRIQLKPASGLVVHFQLPSGSAPSEFAVSVRQTDSVGPGVAPGATTLIDGDLRLAYPNFPPGIYSLSISPRDSYETVLTRVDGIALRRGETTDLGTIDLALPTRQLILPDSRE